MGQVIYHGKPLSCNSNNLRKFSKNFSSVEKNWFEVFEIKSNLARVMKMSNNRYSKIDRLDWKIKTFLLNGK